MASADVTYSRALHAQKAGLGGGFLRNRGDILGVRRLNERVLTNAVI